VAEEVPELRQDDRRRVRAAVLGSPVSHSLSPALHAAAYAELGLMYGAIGESALSMENTSKAYELRDRASDAEKFFITASYDSRVTGNFEKAQQTCETWAQAYPRDPELARQLAVEVLPALSTANVRELLKAAFPLPQLTLEQATDLVTMHLVNRARSTSSRLKSQVKPHDSS